MKRARRGDGRQALVAALVGALVAISIAPLRARAAPFPASGVDLKTAVNNCLAADATGACDCSSPSVDCKEGNGIAIGSWDTSQVTTMEGMFKQDMFIPDEDMFGNAIAFNQDISAWNTAEVTTMKRMFYNAAAFNGDVSAWNTAAVTTMNSMFYKATAFNQDISAWNTAKVTRMDYMFYNAAAFNQSISAWNTAKVTEMGYMFFDADAFNQDISGWNTAAVTDAAWMFSGATAWNSKYERNDASTSTDGPPSAWSIRMCLADQRVVANACVSCPAGTTNAAGDDRSGTDTACDATLCAANAYVSANACVPCPAGTTNAANDDASGTDTACDAAPLSNARTFPHARIAGAVVGFVAFVIVAVALCVRRRRLADDRLRARLGIPTHSAPVEFPPQKPQIIIVQR